MQEQFIAAIKSKNKIRLIFNSKEDRKALTRVWEAAARAFAKAIVLGCPSLTAKGRRNRLLKHRKIMPS